MEKLTAELDEMKEKCEELRVAKQVIQILFLKKPIGIFDYHIWSPKNKFKKKILRFEGQNLDF